jgi:hypothetical protein
MVMPTRGVTVCQGETIENYFITDFCHRTNRFDVSHQKMESENSRKYLANIPKKYPNIAPLCYVSGGRKKCECFVVHANSKVGNGLVCVVFPSKSSHPAKRQYESMISTYR